MRKSKYMLLIVLLCMVIHTVPIYATEENEDTSIAEEQSEETGATIRFRGVNALTDEEAPEPDLEDLSDDTLDNTAESKPNLPQTGEKAGFTLPATGSMVLLIVGFWFYEMYVKKIYINKKTEEKKEL